MMQIQQHDEPLIAFLLVDETARVGVEDAAPVVSVSIDAQPFEVLDDDVEINEIGQGWYAFTLPAEYTARTGPLIVVASAERAAFDWRDIHCVVEPAPTVDAELMRELIEAELTTWRIELRAPVKLVRAGAV